MNNPLERHTMAVQNLRFYPDDALNQTCSEVEDFASDAFFDLVEDLEDSLQHYGGVGIAANQIGEGERVFVLDESTLKTNYVDEEDYQATQEIPLRVFVNPEIVASEGSSKFDEGCLSMPGVTFKVPRATYVKVKALDASGEEFEYEATGYHAAAIQHELDHLDGKMHFMRSEGVSRRMAMKRYRQFRKSYARLQKLERT